MPPKSVLRSAFKETLAALKQARQEFAPERNTSLGYGARGKEFERAVKRYAELSAAMACMIELREELRKI